MTVDEAFMLTLCRLSSLQTLNYSKISPQDRGNSELYYLSLISRELSASPPSAEPRILADHPRYKELCEKYGEPTIKRSTDSSGAGDTVNPRSVAARLVRMTFHLTSTPPSTRPIADNTSQDHQGAREKRAEITRTRTKEIPLSFDTYQVKAIASRLFGLPPLSFNLIWETDELDPVNMTNTIQEDQWDSSEEEDSDSRLDLRSQAETDRLNPNFVKREVELVDSTRDIGFWFPGDLKEVKIRVDSI